MVPILSAEALHRPPLPAREAETTSQGRASLGPASSGSPSFPPPEPPQALIAPPMPTEKSVETPVNNPQTAG